MAKRKPSGNTSRTTSKTKQVIPKVKNPPEDASVSYLRQILSQKYLEKLLSEPLHVKWKGFDRAAEPVGQICMLCENDLSRSPEYAEMELEVCVFSDVAVLACGHSFHLKCFQVAVPVESKAPECFICASMD